jgi:competence protein ComEA
MINELIKKYFNMYWKVIITCLGVILLLVFIVIIFMYTKSNNKVEDKNNLTNNIDGLAEKETIEKENYYVEIKGAIINPGVYKMASNSRVIDVITEAGGLSENADTTPLNLSKKINDEMLVIVYTKDEIISFKDGNKTIKEVIKYIEKECNCPDPIINGACYKDNANQNDESTKISINEASKDELMSLTGIGESKANDIIEYRNVNGTFKTIEDLKNVSGIGDNLFDKIKDYITV